MHVDRGRASSAKGLEDRGHTLRAGHEIQLQPHLSDTGELYLSVIFLRIYGHSHPVIAIAHRPQHAEHGGFRAEPPSQTWPTASKSNSWVDNL